MPVILVVDPKKVPHPDNMFDPDYNHKDPSSAQYGIAKIEQDRFSDAKVKLDNSAVDKAKTKLQNAGKAIGKFIKAGKDKKGKGKD